MRQVQVDFNSVVDSVLPIPTHGQQFAVGERLSVFDEGTDIYEAVMLGVDGVTAFIEVSSDPMATWAATPALGDLPDASAQKAHQPPNGS